VTRELRKRDVGEKVGQGLVAGRHAWLSVAFHGIGNWFFTQDLSPLLGHHGQKQTDNLCQETQAVLNYSFAENGSSFVIPVRLSRAEPSEYS
jgi:hypothetical protein